MSRFSIGGHLGFKIIGILKLVSGSLALVARLRVCAMG